MDILDFKKAKKTSDFQHSSYKCFFQKVKDGTIKFKIDLGFSVFLEKDIVLETLFVLITNFSHERLTKLDNRIKELLEPITQADFAYLTIDKNNNFLGIIHYMPNVQTKEWHCINDVLVDEINKGIL
jgi:hypothetical protein